MSMYDCAVCSAIRCEHVISDSQVAADNIKTLKDKNNKLSDKLQKAIQYLAFYAEIESDDSQIRKWINELKGIEDE